MRVMPASSAAWMVAMERASSGRPSMDIGMPPSPMALTFVSPMVRICTVLLRMGRVMAVDRGLADGVEGAGQVSDSDAPVDGGRVRPVREIRSHRGDGEAA